MCIRDRPYTESGALIIESARKHFGPADKNAPAVALDLDMTAKLMQYLRLLDEKKNAEVYSKEIDKDNLLRLKLEHPDIYEQFVTVSESRRFSVRAVSYTHLDVYKRQSPRLIRTRSPSAVS